MRISAADCFKEGGNPMPSCILFIACEFQHPPSEFGIADAKADWAAGTMASGHDQPFEGGTCYRSWSNDGTISGSAFEAGIDPQGHQAART
jgi:hypothetical protein